MSLNFVNIATLLTCLFTLIAALLLMTRVPWRTGFLCLMVGLMPLTHILFVLRAKLGFPVNLPGLLADMSDLLVSALFLIGVSMLRIDNLERTKAAMRLRLAEALVPGPVGPSNHAASKPAKGLLTFWQAHWIRLR